MRIAVVGGTGVVGRHVVDVARARGHDVAALSRATGIDVLTGEGLVEALGGVETVIDVTNVFSLTASKARAFFETAAGHLLGAEERAGVGHHLVLSIVGIDGIDAGYYAGKLAQERAATAADVASTVVRAAQFHEFVGQALAGTRGPLALLPKLLMRPVSAREVAAHLVTVAEAGPCGRAADLVGPRDEVLADLARRQLALDGTRRRVLEVRLPGAYGKGLASGSLRGGPDAVPGTLTFDEWLRGRDHPRPA